MHTEYAAKIFEIAKNATENGYPIIRPVFWLAPKEENALTCDDQFLLGDDILVAPVLFAGMRYRDIYLPPGNWQDHWTGKIYTGQMIIPSYSAPLEILPFFERL